MRAWPIRASEAPVRARPAAFRGWNPTQNANHPLKANAIEKLAILSLQYIFMFPGHALHEKGLQRQKGVVSLVGSQEERALLVPLINR